MAALSPLPWLRLPLDALPRPAIPRIYKQPLLPYAAQISRAHPTHTNPPAATPYTASTTPLAIQVDLELDIASTSFLLHQRSILLRYVPFYPSIPRSFSLCEHETSMDTMSFYTQASSSSEPFLYGSSGTTSAASHVRGEQI